MGLSKWQRFQGRIGSNKRVLCFSINAGLAELCKYFHLFSLDIQGL